MPISNFKNKAYAIHMGNLYAGREPQVFAKAEDEYIQIPPQEIIVLTSQLHYILPLHYLVYVFKEIIQQLRLPRCLRHRHFFVYNGLNPVVV